MHLLFRTVVALQIWISTITSILVQSQSFRCNTTNDNCPSKFDGTCDANTDPACAGGDCFDCDACQNFEADCEGCLSNGCFWCPGDATCWNAATYTFENKLQSCQLPEEFEENTCVQPGSVFSDPMYSGQSWVYDMIDVKAVWEKGVLGSGVRVRVNDNGVESTHPEFLGRFDVEASCEIYEPVPPEEDTSNAPSSHGTTVAAILGAGANNGECSVGIAPEATISSCYAFYRDDFLAEKLNQFDISLNPFTATGCTKSFAIVRNRARRLQERCPFTFENIFDSTRSFPCSVCDFSNINSTCESSIIAHCESYYEEDSRACSGFLDIILEGKCDYNVLGDQQREDVISGIMEGRGGKGVVYISSSGDLFEESGNASTSIFTNSRFFMTVGAVGKDSSSASYSTPGASLFVTAPGGDVENISNHVTIGMNGSCQDAGIGTSFSSAVVSGVVALILEVNPDLTWRDVQHILAKTSKPVEDADDDTSIRNAASYWHSNFYGFGIVDADAAVRAAKAWENVEPEQILVSDSGEINLGISDNATASALSVVTVESGNENFVLESLEVELDLRHSSRGRLEILLTSPFGTSSILHPGNRTEYGMPSMGERWKLLTVRNWGEDPNGEWTLSLIDLEEEDMDTCSDTEWRIDLKGNSVDCDYITRQQLCVNGETDPQNILDRASFKSIFQTTVNGMLAQEACCSCGGGLNSSSFIDELLSWRMVMYGRTSNSSFIDMVPSAVPSTRPSSSSRTGVDGSFSPSLVPSSLPTDTPSTMPSSKPTENPSTTPSVTRSLSPTVEPSIQPSMIPSSQPSTFPSLQPTTEPSSSPSIKPSPFPSFQPSTMPSVQPSSNPSASPSLQPSERPSSDEQSREVALNFPGVSIKFEGVTMLSADSLAIFEETTEALYKTYYGSSVQSSRRRLNAIAIRNFNTNIKVTKQSLVPLDGNTITYDQAISFITNKQDIDKDVASAILADPFRDPGSVEQYIQQLKKESEEFKAAINILPPRVLVIESENQRLSSIQKDTSGRSAGAKWGLSIVLLFVFFCCCAVLRYKYRGNGDALFPDGPVPTVDVSINDTISQLQDRESEFENSHYYFDMEDAHHRNNRDEEEASERDNDLLGLNSQVGSDYDDSEVDRGSDQHTDTDSSHDLIHFESDDGTSAFDDTDEDESICTILRQIKELKGSNEAKYFEICELHEKLRDLRSAQSGQPTSYLYGRRID